MERKNNGSKSKKKSKDKPYKPQSKEHVQIAAPVAYSQKQEFPNRDRMTSRRIKNSEFVATIVGSTTFNAIQKFVVNPGLVGTFPWLSVLAAEWQQYRINRLSFRYVTRTSTSSVGSVILSPDYNAVDSPPTSEAMASNTQDAVEDVCWRSITCHLDPCAMFPFGPRKQVRVGNINGDYTTYDAARLFVVTTGQTSAADIGKLWVDYDIELFVPQSSGPQSIPPSTSSLSLFENSIIESYSTGVQEVMLWDTTVFNQLSIGYSAGIFTPPAGNYLLTLYAAFSSNTAGNVQTVVQLYKNGAGPVSIINNSQGYVANAGANYCVMTYVVANGTDTFELRNTMTGAGTLNTRNVGNQVLWALA